MLAPVVGCKQVDPTYWLWAFALDVREGRRESSGEIRKLNRASVSPPVRF